MSAGSEVWVRIWRAVKVFCLFGALFDCCELCEESLRFWPLETLGTAVLEAIEAIIMVLLELRCGVVKIAARYKLSRLVDATGAYRILIALP